MIQLNVMDENTEQKNEDGNAIHSSQNERYAGGTRENATNIEWSNGVAQRQGSTPKKGDPLKHSKWLTFIFRSLAIFWFLIAGSTVIFTTFSIASSAKEFPVSTLPTSLLALLPTVQYVVAYLISIAYLIYFGGIYTMRKWVIPILLVLSFSYIVKIIIAVFEQTQDYVSSLAFFTLLWIGTSVVLTILACIYRQHFTGSYKKLLIQIPFFAIIIPVFIVDSLTLLFPDLPEITDSDIRIEKVISPPKTENAYFQLIRINEQVYQPDFNTYQQFIEGRRWDQNEVNFILDQNKKVLQMMREAAMLSYYQCPTTISLSFSEEYCPLNYMRSSTQIAALSSLLLNTATDLSPIF